MLILIFLVLQKSVKDPPIKIFSLITKYLVFIFLLSFFSTDNIYNIAFFLLLFISIIYMLNYSSNKFNTIEFYFLFSYFLFFIYPFFHSYFMPSDLSEVDNYVRFLFAIPIYLLFREIRLKVSHFIYLINIVAISFGFVAIYFSLTDELSRVRGFTSTTTIFGNISILLCILSYFSISYFQEKNLNYKYLPYVSIFSSFLAWSLSDTRGSIVALIITILVLALFTTSRNKFFVQCKKTTFAFIAILGLILIFSGSHIRLIKAYQSSYDYFTHDISFNHKESGSVIPRISIWKGSLNMINDNILLGVGLNNFNSELEKQIADKKIKPIRYDYGTGNSQERIPNLSAGLNHAHSQYLDTFAKTGIFGFISLIYFLLINLLFFIKYYFKNNDNIYSKFGIVTSLMYISFMLSHTILSHHQSTLFMITIMVILAGLCNNFSQKVVR